MIPLGKVASPSFFLLSSIHSSEKSSSVLKSHNITSCLSASMQWLSFSPVGHSKSLSKQGGSYASDSQNRLYGRVRLCVGCWPVKSDHVGWRRDKSLPLCSTNRRTGRTPI